MKSKHIIPICLILGIIPALFGFNLGWNYYKPSFTEHPILVIFLVSLSTLGFIIPSTLFPYLILRKIIRNSLNKAIKEQDTTKIIEILNKDEKLIYVKDVFDAPPIFLAVRCENIEAIKILIQKGSKTNLKDSKGITLQQYAILTRNEKIIELITDKINL